MCQKPKYRLHTVCAIHNYLYTIQANKLFSVLCSYDARFLYLIHIFYVYFYFLLGFLWYWICMDFVNGGWWLPAWWLLIFFVRYLTDTEPYIIILRIFFEFDDFSACCFVTLLFYLLSFLSLFSLMFTTQKAASSSSVFSRGFKCKADIFIDTHFPLQTWIFKYFSVMKISWFGFCTFVTRSLVLHLNLWSIFVNVRQTSFHIRCDVDVLTLNLVSCTSTSTSKQILYTVNGNHLFWLLHLFSALYLPSKFSCLCTQQLQYRVCQKVDVAIAGVILKKKLQMDIDNTFSWSIWSISTRPMYNDVRILVNYQRKGISRKNIWFTSSRQKSTQYDKIGFVFSTNENKIRRIFLGSIIIIENCTLKPADYNLNLF